MERGTLFAKLIAPSGGLMAGAALIIATTGALGSAHAASLQDDPWTNVRAVPADDPWTRVVVNGDDPWTITPKSDDPWTSMPNGDDPWTRVVNNDDPWT
ncbi:hypothetical protein GCM10020367_43870 [Streptomyces sannanensis]|uniref:Uncharacterized protein n=1 Tax=Streptomyces sannanensis TaxID=285536 RepID=A0ABP6SFZ8_9ACTN